MPEPVDAARVCGERPSPILRSTANVSLRYNGDGMETVAFGMGPIDAAFHAIENLVQSGAQLASYTIHSMSRGVRRPRRSDRPAGAGWQADHRPGHERRYHRCQHQSLFGWRQPVDQRPKRGTHRALPREIGAPAQYRRAHRAVLQKRPSGKQPPHHTSRRCRQRKEGVLPMSKTRIISRKEAEQLLTMEACIAAMEQTLQESRQALHPCCNAA